MAGETTGETDGSTTERKYVFLRVKRKRTDTPLDTLLIQKQPQLKRRHTDASKSSSGEAQVVNDEHEAAESTKASQEDKKQFIDAFASLSTKDESFVLKRIDTMQSNALGGIDHSSKWTERMKKKVKAMKTDRSHVLHKPVPTARQSIASTAKAHMKDQQKRAHARRQSEMQRARRLPSTTEENQPQLEMKEEQTLNLSGVKVVDLSTVGAKSTEDTQTEGLEVSGKKLKTKRVLTPGERQLDEAVWVAFQHNDFAGFFHLAAQPPAGVKADARTFQRPADGGSVLMAAAMHGRVDVIESVLRHAPSSVLLKDWEGNTAANFAALHNHPSVESALLACEKAELDKEYVYDVYCVETTQEHDTDEQKLPVVSVSSSVQQWLMEDAKAEQDEEYVNENLLESDIDSNDEVDGESLDSNDEGYALNDYPEDEESSESDWGSSDSEEPHERMHSWKPSHQSLHPDEADY